MDTTGVPSTISLSCISIAGFDVINAGCRLHDAGVDGLNLLISNVLKHGIIPTSNTLLRYVFDSPIPVFNCLYDTDVAVVAPGILSDVVQALNAIVDL